MRKRLLFVLSVAALLAFVSLLRGQQASVANVVQHTATMPNAATKVANLNTAVNTQASATLTPAGSNYVYVTGIDMAYCGDATGTAQTNVSFNWTGGISPTGSNIPIWAYSTVINPGLCTFKFVSFPVPLKSVTPGTAVTLQSPAVALHTGYEANVYWYEAP
jgi:hypothetical protein